ncbi:hypothetical protein LCGC14_2956530 [marine sediment metagenome]|uniref:Uncharacterized protein n=1 Tax=marine sediment metagenome TaxID=412755 RepID=A0A0F8ZLB1_9ZZZZ
MLTLNVSKETWQKVQKAALSEMLATHHPKIAPMVRARHVVNAILLELKIEIKVSDG